jgi:hypothetical protein
MWISVMCDDKRFVFFFTVWFVVRGCSISFCIRMCVNLCRVCFMWISMMCDDKRFVFVFFLNCCVVCCSVVRSVCV